MLARKSSNTPGRASTACSGVMPVSVMRVHISSQRARPFTRNCTANERMCRASERSSRSAPEPSSRSERRARNLPESLAKPFIKVRSS